VIQAAANHSWQAKEADDSSAISNMTKCLKVLQPKDTLIAIRGGLKLGARIWGDEAAINVPPEVCPATLNMQG